MTPELASRIAEETRRAVGDLLEAADPRPGGIFLLGISTSELVGENIGSSGDPAMAAAVMDPLVEMLRERRLELAVQCCEHLNRCLVVERSLARREGLVEVSVLPRPWAGGSGASYAFEVAEDPTVVETISADLGMDVGDTFIGMHLRPVVVPVRLGLSRIGCARLTAARTRPALVGGARAEYPEDSVRERQRISRSR